MTTTDEKLIRRALRLLGTALDDAIKVRLRHGERLDSVENQRDAADRDRCIVLAAVKQGDVDG